MSCNVKTRPLYSLGSFSIDAGAGSESERHFKIEFAFFPKFVANFPGVDVFGDCTQVYKEKEKFVVAS